MTWRRRGVSQGLSIFLVGLTLGLLLSLGWQSLSQTPAEVSDESASRIHLSIDRLESEQQELKGTLAELRNDLAEHQQAASARTDRLQVLQDELERQRLLAGLVAVQGPGVSVTLDDSGVRIPRGGQPDSYIIHEYDLRDIVNLLWTAGSEAIAINQERLVGASSVYCVGSTVMVNNTRLSPPYVIQAIGNPRVQKDFLRNPAYLKGLREKAGQYGLGFQVSDAESMTLPAYSGSILVRHARPGE